MNRVESFVVASVLAVGILLLTMGCCWLCFIALWLVMMGLFDCGIPGKGVIVTVLVVCLLLGVAVEIRFLSEWTRGVYQASMKLMAGVYLISSVVAIALGMGVPVGNLALGVMAGLYIGRRCFHSAEGPDVFKRASRRVGLFAGVVVALVSLPVGLLALVAGEEHTARVVVKTLGFAYCDAAGLGLVVTLCVVLMVMQYALTRGAATLAYRR